MTVALETTRYVYTGNGVTASFPFPVPFLEAADLDVRLLDTDLQAEVASGLNGGGLYDYTVTGTQDPESGQYLDGGTVVLNNAPPASIRVYVSRAEPLTQGLALVDAFKFPASSVNTALDKLTMIAQANRDFALRSVRAPWSDLAPPSDVPMELPTVQSRAGGIMGFDSIGRPSVQGNLDVLIALMAGEWVPSLTEIDWVGSITGLRALAPPASTAFVMLTGYNNPGDKAPVVYVYSLTDSRADDGGLVIKPNSISGAGRWLGLLGARFNVVDWGADQSGASACDTAFANWFAAIKANGAAGYIPIGIYKFTSAVYWDLTSVATSGITIIGDGVQKSVLDFTGVATNPNLLIGGTVDLFYPTLRDFGIKGNIAGTVMRWGHQDFSDPINESVVDIWVSNASTSSTAVAIELNYVLNSRPFSAVANCGGDGVALWCRQAVFNTFMGSYGNAGKDINFTDGFNYGNVFVAVDCEAVGVCVEWDGGSGANNLFLGGTYVWSGASAIVANVASDWNRFVCPNFGSAGTVLTGAAAASILIEDKHLGTSPFGGVRISPPSGDGALTIDSIAGNSSDIVFSRGGSTRFHLGRNNEAESGSNAGSKFVLEAFSDTGVSLGDVFFVDRATRRLTIDNEFATQTGSKVGLFGAVPVVQPDDSFGSSSETSAGSTNATFEDTTFTGGIGATAYTIGKLIAALKTVGAIKS